MLTADALNPAPPADADGVARVSARPLVLGTVGAMVVCAICCSLIALLLNTPDIWRGLLAGGIGGVIASLLSLIPIAYVANKPFHWLLNGYLIGSALRAICTLGVVLLAIKVGGYPKWPTLAFAGAFYFTLLIAEAAILSRMTWTSAVPAK